MGVTELGSHRDSGEAAGTVAATRWTYAGLFLITLATLAYQVVLTRIFSVTLFYHFAFLAVSLAMLGMTAGAILVYLFPRFFVHHLVHRHLALSAFAFGLTIVLSLLTHLIVPVVTDGTLLSIYSIVFTCVTIAVPYTASGICITLVLTRFPCQISRLYATDLAGAAVGCWLVVLLLRITDGPTAVFAVALIASLGGLCFAVCTASRALQWLVAVTAVGLAAFVVGNTALVHAQSSLLRITWMGSPDGPRLTETPLHERWNSHSRIRVFGDPDRPSAPFGWSLSPRAPVSSGVRQLYLDIDAGALTVLTAFDGSLEPLGYLRFDLTNLAHYLRSDAKVLVIGAGGGRDVLSALVFTQASVVGVEVNKNILEVAHGVYGEFTGHLDRHPKVTFINDEARSYVARSRERFDIIQISLIDSFAATAAGAYVLTEHSLYTVEAWKIFLEHLTTNGILTVTHYYFPERPGTAYRLTSLAAAALAELGAETPRGHIAMFHQPPPPSMQPTMCTILVGKNPFSELDVTILERVADQLGFEPTVTPRFAADKMFEQIASGGDLSQLSGDFPLKIIPSTDDSPFFFHMMRMRDMFRSHVRSDQGVFNVNMRAVFILGILLIAVVGMSLLFIAVPLAIRSQLGNARVVAPWLLVFAGIGLGFMMIEISQMERLIVFLGHPVYALSGVLFTLLLTAGLGSLSTQRILDSELPRAAAMRLGILLLLLSLFGLLTSSFMRLFQGAGTPARILVSVVVLSPLGFFMGMPFPMGLKAASSTSGVHQLTPWLWGINGAMGVLASVLAIVIALSAGISASYWVGVGCYALATLAFFWAMRTKTAAA